MDQDLARMIIADIVAHDYDGTERCSDQATASIAGTARTSHSAAQGALEALQVLRPERATQICRELWVESCLSG
jgi:hypothetical protein